MDHYYSLNSSIPLTMAEIGGYDCQLTEKPPDSLICPVCLLPHREPHLISCCGIKVCNCCISRVQLAGQPCPFCRTPEFHTMIDRDIERQVLSLKVYCNNKEDGCTWIGELRQLERHLDTCFYHDTISCKYKCGLRCPQQQMLIHEREECELRPEIVLTKTIDELTKRITELESTCKEQSLMIKRQQDIIEAHQLQSNNQYLHEQAYKLSEERKEIVLVGSNEDFQVGMKKERKNQVNFTASVNIDDMMTELTRRQEKIDELEDKLKQLQIKFNDITGSTESDVVPKESPDTKETAMNGLKNLKQAMTKSYEQIKRRVPDSFRSGQSSQRHSSQTNPPTAPYNPPSPLVLHFPPQQSQPWPPQQPQPRPPQQPQPRPPQQPQPRLPQQPQPRPPQQPQPWPPQQPQLQPQPSSRVCPICNLVYPMNVSQQEFEHHVNSHFQ